MIKTAVIGASGFIGRHLWSSYRARYADGVGTAFSNGDSALVRFDLRAPDLSRLRLEETGHRAVIIASAKPNIAFCEREPAAARAVNVEGTLELARQIARTGMQTIFLSSDYVFAGEEGPYDDDAIPRPATEYGRQKARVEQELLARDPRTLILRLSKIYGVGKGDRTLLDEMAESLAGGRTLQAARDQVFSPTNVGDVVRLVHAVQERELSGILNVASPERWSRAEIAFALGEAMSMDRARVEAIALHDLSSMVGRPLDTSLRSARLAREVQPHFTPLRDDILRVAAQWRT